MIEVGNTPLLEVDAVYAKLECTNPLGSIKDRIAKYIIEQSERLGLLRPGMTIVEASSGNTGIALSYFAREKGYPTIIVMPRNMSDERKRILKKLGAKLILCSEGNFAKAAKIRDEIAKNPGYFNPDQFSNPLNAECHYRTTAQEILDQIKSYSDTICAFVSGVGTGGTLIGCGKRLKEAFPKIKIVAVEPLESRVMSGGEPGLHGIQGIGDGFIPAIVSDEMGGLDKLIDDVLCISTGEAKDAARYLAKERQLCVGISSGANFLVAKRVAKKYGTTITVFPDGVSKYRSQGLTRQGTAPCQNRKKCNCTVKARYLLLNPRVDCKCN
ncbi:MAG: cysteine synthase family protein [Candidatus Bathyarchaeota archaeon]|nr:MAG: cysteine synthase family protein [Candidatus Bathyarchaeota archaeon]